MNDTGVLISMVIIFGPILVGLYLLWWLGNVARSLRRIASALEKQLKPAGDER